MEDLRSTDARGGESGSDGGAPGSASRTPTVLAEELTGSLRCASCRYELRGLSVKGECPECGLPIQATLLSIVDPMAEELQPVRRPWLVASGLVAWSAGALLGALAGWFVWMSGASALVYDVQTAPGLQRRISLLGAAALVVSGLGAATVVRPYAATPRRRVASALCGVAIYPLVVWLYADLCAEAGSRAKQSLLSAWTFDPDPAPWRAERLLFWLSIAAGGWLLRGNLRMLAARSLVLRSRRVDRQTIAAGVAALLTAALGDAIGLAAGMVRGGLAGSLVLMGEVLVLLGAVLMTLGMIGVAVDTFRLLPAVIHRPLARRDVVRAVGVPEGGKAGA